MYSKGKTNLEMSSCSLDLLTNIYNCTPKDLMQIFQYFLYTLKYKKISHRLPYKHWSQNLLKSSQMAEFIELPARCSSGVTNRDFLRNDLFSFVSL